jgi:hypothetical protein
MVSTYCSPHWYPMRTLRINRPALLVLSLIVLAAGCYRSKEPFRQPQADFFPLAAHSTWTYSVYDKSQARPFTIMDTVVGRRYIPALNLTGTLVEEYCNLERADPNAPLIFFSQNGYIVRVSALVHSRDQITEGPFGAVSDDKFLPARLLDQQSWDDELWPFGHWEVPLKAQINAHTHGETEDIVVPAGRFHQCIRIESIVSYSGGLYEGRHLHLTFIDWYAPSVGLVQSVVHSGNSDGTVISRRVLRAYQVKQ